MPVEVLDQFVREGPLTAAEVEAVTRRFKIAIIEQALGAELSHHLGYAPGEATNHRNATSGKTVLTDDGPLSIEVPRDRQGTFEPQLIGKHEGRFTPCLKPAPEDSASRRLARRGDAPGASIIPFFAVPPEVRRVIYTTNALESVHARIRKVIKPRGHFPNDDAATKLIWLALRNITAEWRRPAHHWRAAMNQVAILDEDRFTKAML